MEIIQIVTLEDVRNAHPKTIWYAARTCWWTHLPEHLATKPPTPGDIRSFAETLRLNSSTPNAPLEDFFERARNASRGLPCDPRGSVLFMTDDVEGFLTTAEKNPAHYGKHGLRAFMAAHHQNCIESGQSLRPWSETTWAAYNEAIDRFDEKLKIITTAAMAKLDELTKEK